MKTSSRAGIGKIGSPLAGGIFSGMTTYQDGQKAALVLAPQEFGEYTATLKIAEDGEIIHVPLSGPQWDSSWAVPTRDEMELLIAVWTRRKAPIDIAWYESDQVAWQRYNNRTTEFNTTNWYLSSSTLSADPTSVWAVYGGDGDAIPKGTGETAIVRLVRRIPIV